jgi:N-formylglutamate deformylase
VKLYNLLVPARNTIPLVSSLPHSGTHVPRRVDRQFRRYPGPVLSPVDWHLEKLYDFLPGLGVTMLQATHSRYVVNLNRGLEEPLFGPERSSAVSEKTCFGRTLYDVEPDRSQVEERINRYYVSYHRRLAGILDKMVRDYGHVYLLDLHSYYLGPQVDVCLGNANETTCSEPLIGVFETALSRHGFNVVRNEVWTGGYITRHYGNMDNMEALQIELRFPAYLEGDTFEEEEVPEWDSDKFRNAKERLRRVFSDVIEELF